MLGNYQVLLGSASGRPEFENVQDFSIYYDSLARRRGMTEVEINTARNRRSRIGTNLPPGA